MALLLIALATILLSGVCRLSLEKSVRSAREAEDLQRRWGEVSCRSTLLPRAERLFAGAGRSGGSTADAAGGATVEAEVWLGGQRFELLFGDEQAKLDVASLYGRGGRARAERAARMAARMAARRAGRGGAPRLEVRLRPVVRPVPAAAGRAARAAAFDSFGQVFQVLDGAGPGGAAAAELLPAASRYLTCWGGRLNWRRAAPADLEAWCDPVLNKAQVGQLLRARQGHGTRTGPSPAAAPASLSAALAALQVPEEKQAAAAALLADGSQSHSIWVITRWPGGCRCSFTVLEERPGEPAETHVFSW